MKMIGNKTALFILLFAAWLILSWSLDAEHLIAGFAVAALIAVLSGDLFSFRVSKFLQLRRYAWFLYLLPVLLWDMLKANLSLTAHIAHPVLSPRAGALEVKTDLKSGAALAFLANALTLVGDTLAVDADPVTGMLHLHCLTLPGSGDGRTVGLARKYERFMKNIFE